MSNQVTLEVHKRDQHGKGATGRLRKEGRTPAIVYGYDVDPTPVSVDALDLYHALHTEAGTNVLLRVTLDGDEHLCVARDLQRHAVRGDVQHVDFLAVDKDSQILVEVPIHLTDVPSDGVGVVNQVLWTVPVLVRPLETPNYLELSCEGMEIGDVRRVEDLRAYLPSGAEFDIDPERTVVTVNAPDILEEPSEEEAAIDLEGLEGEELEAALAEAAEAEAAEGEASDEGETPEE